MAFRGRIFILARSAEFGTFLRAPALTSHWLTIFADDTPMTGKLINKTILTLSETPVTIQSTFYHGSIKLHSGD